MVKAQQKNTTKRPSTLTETQRADVMRRLRRHETVSAIAKFHGVTPAAIFYWQKKLPAAQLAAEAPTRPEEPPQAPEKRMPTGHRWAEEGVSPVPGVIDVTPPVRPRLEPLATPPPANGVEITQALLDALTRIHAGKESRKVMEDLLQRFGTIRLAD